MGQKRGRGGRERVERPALSNTVLLGTNVPVHCSGVGRLEIWGLYGGLGFGWRAPSACFRTTCYCCTGAGDREALIFRREQ